MLRRVAPLALRPLRARAVAPFAALAAGQARWCAGAPGGVGGPVTDGPDTHPDFRAKAPQSAEEDDDEIKAIKSDIDETIRDEDVVLFMKGSPEAPVCGFSKKIVDLLDALCVEYTSFDVLAHPTVRSYVKEVSDWPTIPQLFVKGEFVGGNDVVFEQASNGQLQILLEQHGIEHKPIKL